MIIEQIFLMQFVLSTIVVGLLAKWYLAPLLAKKPLQLALMVLLTPHAFRHIGMAFVVPALNHPDMPVDFAMAAAYGDLLSGLLALAAMIALKRNWTIAIPIVWIFSLVGTIDLINALRQEAAIMYMGVTWFIPTFIVPILLVSHVMIFLRLILNTRRY